VASEKLNSTTNRWSCFAKEFCRQAVDLFHTNESQGENMQINGFQNLPVVKLTDEQIAAGKAGGELLKDKIASGEITIKYPDKPILQPGVIYHPSEPAQPSQPSDTPTLVAIDTPLTYDSRGTVILKPQG
jgi:hypothetical protein